ncbi:MAG: N-acetylmuramoyl-L-alanine amidase [Lachnospiraceae bacterium]|nr:N-acetylmuramoyl-L-alanine amidase [Lachnospiraceae bacterium]
MSGPIAFILAMMISTAVAIGDADLSGIIEEAERIEQEEKEKEKAAEYLIAIDPGHQEKGNFGQEPIGPGASQTKTKVAGGTKGRSSGVPEYQLTLDVSLKLRDILEDKGYKVLMIRETNDVDITNAERAKMANEADADVFVRVHANGSESSSANGAMTICQTSSNPYNSGLYEKSRSLSQQVLDAYTETTGIRREYVWETDTMSGINWCTVPVTIIELGYMTNPEEDEKMQESDFQDLMAEGIAEGIENYLADLSDDGSAESDEEAASLPEEAPEEDTSEEASVEGATEAASPEEEAAGEAQPESESSEEGSSAASSSETALPEEEDIVPAINEEKPSSDEKGTVKEKKITVYTVPASKTERAAKELREILSRTGESVVRRHILERYVRSGVQMKKLKDELNKEIGRLGGRWSLYLRRMDTGQTIRINDDEKMIAASLIKLFIAGEFFTLGEQGELNVDDYYNKPDLMISISDNGAANALISACTMDKINEFVIENGFEETELNRRMLDWNGTENYTSTRDCGKLLEEVLKGEYVSEEASERILEALKNQQRTSKIPAGVPGDVETANKTGELDNVDNDAAIVWSPECTYILCIMSSDTGGRIAEIRKLSSMVYDSIGASED